MKSPTAASPAKSSFDQLRTVKDVQTPLRPAAIRIYRELFPGCQLENLRENGVKVHVLDKHFGIDSILYTASGQGLTIQEKYRDYPKWTFHDFTQETRNGDGSAGEWSSLGAQMYFYGWGDPDKRVFLEWFLMSIPHYKDIVEQGGGLDNLGKRQKNVSDGSSIFYGIPFETIRPAIMYFGTGQTWLKRLDSHSFSEPKVMTYPYQWTGVLVPGVCRLSKDQAGPHDCYEHPKNGKLVCRKCGSYVEN